MPTEIKKWKTVDQHEFDTELEALRHENAVLMTDRKELIALKAKLEEKVREGRRQESNEGHE